MVSEPSGGSNIAQSRQIATKKTEINPDISNLFIHYAE